MYDLAPRFPEQDNVKKCFEPEIFAIDDANGTCACKGPCYPFTSSFNRFKKKTLAESPSPAHYCPKYRKYRIIGGKSMQYTTPRICIVPHQGPSPLSYDLFSDYIPTIPRKIFKRKEVSHLYRAKCPGFSSFERDIEITNEEIKPVVAPSTPLPDYLKFPGETSKTTIKYKGTRWGNYKSERKGLEIVSDVPGPGAYDTGQKKVVKKLRPFVEKKEPKVRKCQPAPPETPGFQEFGSEENIQPFRYCCGAQESLRKDAEQINKCRTIWGCSERFKFSTNDNPPPWAYSPTFATCHRKIVKFVPFASCKPRFTYPKQMDLSPASHNPLNGTIKQKICSRLVKYRGTLTAPFGSTAPRLKPDPTNFDFEISDSDSEQKQSYLAVVQVIPPQNKSDNQEEVKEDVYNSECDYDLEIGPTLFVYDKPPKRVSLEDMREVYKRYKSRRDHRKPLTREGFLSTTEHRSSWLVAKTAAHDVNWPEIDDMIVTGGALKMNMPSHTKEMQPKEDLSVYYDIHPCYGSSVYKPTHNYRLKKEDIISPPIEDENNVRLILKCFMPKEILNA